MTRPVVQVRLIDFPAKGNEVVTKNEDDTYTVFINARLSHEKQQEVYTHALEHIKRGDFEKDNADKIELDAHRTEVSVELCGIA